MLTLDHSHMNCDGDEDEERPIDRLRAATQAKAQRLQQLVIVPKNERQ